MAALSGPGWSRQAGFLLAGDLVKMRAAVLTGVNAALRVAEVDLAPPRAGEVLVRVAASGLCRSDLNAITGKRTLVPFPSVIGHEASGVVVECAQAWSGCGREMRSCCRSSLRADPA